MDIKTLPQRWTAAWSDDSQQQVWVDCFTPDAKYVDHAFLIRRQGHKTLARHWKLWRTSNPDFIMKIAEDMPVWYDIDEKGNGRVSFRTVNSGTFKNDLLHYKATGKRFEFRGVIDLVVEGGRIKRLDEWYTHTPFGETRAVGEYHTVVDEGLERGKL